MSRTWFFQANPRQYDIDAALDSLDRIWWRVPQYTGEIHPGDVVVIWRSGQNAGIVGVGRVASEPRLRSSDPDEQPFLTGRDEDGTATTRVLVLLRKSPLVTKDELRALDAFQEHQILLAPMGTVFAVSEEQWDRLRQLLPPPPDLLDEPSDPLPAAFAWDHRAKGVLPMPGGYSGYLDSLNKVCNLVEEERPSPSELASRLQSVLHVKAAAARLRASFLRRASIVVAEGGVCRLSGWALKWRETGDNRLIVALLHSRCQLIGELLDAASEPKTNEELLRIANEKYDMGWDTTTQILNRRGWLQSAGMLVASAEGTVHTSEAGQGLLRELALYVPGVIDAHPDSGRIPESPPVTTPPLLATTVEDLIEEMRVSATDSQNPNRFEDAVRNIFAFMGFEAERLGGSGRTDVLLDAVLGKEDHYRVTVDCKTSASGSVGDQQVDWVTLTDHKRKHDAQHVALVTPNPSGARLFERAADRGVAVFSVEQLAGLCKQHAKTPLGLDDYRVLFLHGGAVDTQPVGERADESGRILTLAARVCEVVRAKSEEFGRLSARDLYLLLASDPVSEGTTEDELQDLLATLASPLIRILDGTEAAGYRVTNSASVSRARLEVIAHQLQPDG